MKYIVLLRGVNIGGRKVKSVELKECFKSAGFKHPKTVLATGNIIVDSDLTTENLTLQVEELLLNAFKFLIKVIVIPAQKLVKIVENYPFQNIDKSYHRYVVFKDKEAKNIDIELDKTIENSKPVGSIIYWYVKKGHTLDSDFAKLLAKEARKEFSTTRNINTLNKIIKNAGYA